MTHQSQSDLLILHAVRLNGFAGESKIAARFALDPDATAETLAEHGRQGRLSWSAFAGLSGWSLTEAGRQLNDEQLREELDTIGARATVEQVHHNFLPLNAEVSAACSAVQLDPASFDTSWDLLSQVATQLQGLETALSDRLSRFTGYHRRFATALFRADDEPGWLTGVEQDSCHRVWFELHEDLIATLGLTR